MANLWSVAMLFNAFYMFKLLKNHWAYDLLLTGISAKRFISWVNQWFYLLSLLICNTFCGRWGSFTANKIRPDRDQDADVGHANEDHGDEPCQDHEDPDVRPRESVAREIVERATDQVCLEITRKILCSSHESFQLGPFK